MIRPSFVLRACLGLAALFFALTFSGCRKPVYGVNIYPGLSLFRQYRALRNGQPIADAALDQYGKISFEVTGETLNNGVGTIKTISVEALSPCGWRSQKVDFNPTGNGQVRKADGSRMIPLYNLSVSDPDQDAWHTISVFVDNRGGGNARVGVGAFERRVDQGQYADLSLPISRLCPAADQLTLNGNTIASIQDLESRRKKKDGLARLLLDTTANHCYTYEWQKYSLFFFSMNSAPASGSRALPAMRVRPIDDAIDYYFQDLPEKVETQNLSDRVVATLKDRNCGG